MIFAPFKKWFLGAPFQTPEYERDGERERERECVCKSEWERNREIKDEESMMDHCKLFAN